jgi:glycosyltransferase involved in cell wall biosynthesis
MRIAMLHTDLPGVSRGGVAYQVSRLANALVGRGHEVTVFTFSPRPLEAEYSVRTLWRGFALSNTRAGRLLFTPLAFALRGYRAFDVIHAHGDDYLLFGRPEPIVRTFYGSARDEARVADRLPRKLVQRFLFVAEQVSRRTATVTVGISETTSRALGSLDVVIPCGVDREIFHPGEKSRHPTVLFVGTLDGRKRGRLLIDAFRTRIRAELPDSELWLVGDGLPHGEGVRAWGRVSDQRMARLMREAWALAVPSAYEGFGVPYVEAMASGTAVVTTDNEGARELFQATSSGVIASDREFPEAVLSVLRDSALREDLAAQGRDLSERFAWPRIANRYEEVYRLALEEKRGRRGADVE